MRLFLGNLGKALNRLDGVRGQVFERRFDAIRIVDDASLIERIAYCVANPAQADLVSTYSAWSGVCAYGRSDVPTVIETHNVRHAEYERACARADAHRAATGDAIQVDRELYTDRLELELVSSGFDEEVGQQIAEREANAAAARGHKPVLGSRRAATQDPFAAPRKSKRSPRPLCHAATAAAKQRFREVWYAFVNAYREASASFRAGEFLIDFPDYSFRPWVPLFGG